MVPGPLWTPKLKDTQVPCIKWHSIHLSPPHVPVSFRPSLHSLQCLMQRQCCTHSCSTALFRGQGQGQGKKARTSSVQTRPPRAWPHGAHPQQHEVIFSNNLNLQLVGSVGAEPADTEGRLDLFSAVTRFSASSFLATKWLNLYRSFCYSAWFHINKKMH